MAIITAIFIFLGTAGAINCDIKGVAPDACIDSLEVKYEYPNSYR